MRVCGAEAWEHPCERGVRRDAVAQVKRQAGTEYKKQRSPAYCDRILWRSSPYLNVSPPPFSSLPFSLSV